MLDLAALSAAVLGLRGKFGGRNTRTATRRFPWHQTYGKCHNSSRLSGPVWILGTLLPPLGLSIPHPTRTQGRRPADNAPGHRLAMKTVPTCNSYQAK